MKQDQRRISKERHEIAYCRKLAREFLSPKIRYVNSDKLKRVSKAFLKFTRGYSKWK